MAHAHCYPSRTDGDDPIHPQVGIRRPGLAVGLPDDLQGVVGSSRLLLPVDLSLTARVRRPGCVPRVSHSQMACAVGTGPETAPAVEDRRSGWGIGVWVFVRREVRDASSCSAGWYEQPVIGVVCDVVAAGRRTAVEQEVLGQL